MNGTATTNNGGNTMSDGEKKAWRAGVEDKQHGYTNAYKRCKERAATGCKMSAAYCRGYEGSGVGE